MKKFVEVIPSVFLRVGTVREAASRTWRLEPGGWVAADGSGATPPREISRPSADWTPSLTKPMAM